MRFRIFFCALFLLMSVEAHAEVASKCGTVALEQMRGRVEFERPAAKIVLEAPPFAKEDTLGLWAWDFDLFQPKFYKIETTCQLVTEHCYVFVEDEQWESSVNAEKVASLAAATT